MAAASGATATSLSSSLIWSPPRGARSVLPASVQFGSKVGGGSGLSKPARRMTAFCSPDVPMDDTPIELKYSAFPTVMDINKIRDILPHRFPFLLVDRVIEYIPGVSVVAIKNVTINDGFFPGHFPEGPIMPGVLIVEAMAQVGGIVLPPEEGESRNNFFLAGIDKVMFHKPVIAGDTLVMRVNVIKLQRQFRAAKMEGKAYVGGDIVCESEFLSALGSE